VHRQLLTSLVVLTTVAISPLEGQSALAPGGTLRAAFIAGNPAMAVTDPATGESVGPAVDLAHEFGRQAGVPVMLLGVRTPQNVIDAVTNGQADIGFVAYNPERTGTVDFSQPFMLVQQTFLVRQDSSIRSVADIDRPGQRIGARTGDSLALYLARTLKQAELVQITEKSENDGATALAEGQLDAFGSNRQRLRDTSRSFSGLRVLPDELYSVEQNVIVQKGRFESLKTVNQLIDNVRRSGFLAESIARSGVVGIAVANPAVR
jgi:polar amino acid transport system substrate-binding protein